MKAVIYLFILTRRHAYRLDLLKKRQVRVERLISHHLPLEQIHEGVALMRERKALKVYFQIAGETYGK